MVHHHYAKHKGITLPKGWNECMVQRLNQSNSRTFFKVTVPPVSSAEIPPLSSKQILSTLIEDTRKKVNNVHSTIKAEISNARLISPWLLSCKWHIYTEGYETETLQSMVAYPKPSEFPGLAALVSIYCKHIIDTMAITDQLVLQRLHTPDPLKT